MNEDILGFEVSVNYLFVMHEFQALANLF